MVEITQFPLDRAEIVAFFLESCLYGALLTLYAITIWVLVQKRTGKFNVPLLAVSTTMTVLATAHIGIDTHRMLFAFTRTSEPVEYFGLISEVTSVLKSVIWVTQTVVGDFFVIYRAYIVWGHNLYIVSVPICLALGTAITGYNACAALARATAGTPIFSIYSWITAVFSTTLATNIICTSLVAFRIWATHRRVKNHGATSLWPVMVIVIESGAIFSSCLVCLLVCFAVGSNGQYPALDAAMPLVGITFNLIIVRIGLGLAVNSTNPTRLASTRNHVSNHGRATAVHMPTITTTSHRMGEGEPYPLQNMDRLSIKVNRSGQESSDAQSQRSFGRTEEDKYPAAL